MEKQTPVFFMSTVRICCYLQHFVASDAQFYCKLQHFLNFEMSNSFLPIGLFFALVLNQAIPIRKTQATQDSKKHTPFVLFVYPIGCVKLKERCENRPKRRNDLQVFELRICCVLQHFRAAEATKCCK